MRSTVSYTLAANLEDLELSGSQSINATGNATANTLRGNAAANRLDGGAGADMLVGGLGDDSYVVDNVADIAYEIAGGGVDSVQSSVTLTLRADVENLSLAGAGAINGSGNTQDNQLRGNAAANTLSGLAGNDLVSGESGNDKLYGGDGNDVLAGDAANEVAALEQITSLVVYARGSVCEGVWPTMEVWLGGVKVQSFTVVSAELAAYTVTAPLGMGAASVDISFINDAYRPDLGQDRNLYLERIEVNGRSLSARDVGAVLDYGSGATAFDGLNTTLSSGTLGSHGAIRIGLGGNDLLDGGAGVDAMAGGFGNDLYLVDNALDAISEQLNAGHDIVRSTVSYTLAANLEDLELSGTQAIDATGNAANNTLRGNTAANRLDGGAGGDMLVGGAGSDTYVLGRGYGAESIWELDLSAGNTDVAEFGAGIASDQLWFRQLGNTLEVSVVGSNDKLNISNWYVGSQHHIEQFRTSDGRTLLDSQVQNLVSAMAAFAPPAMGLTTLPPVYANQLAAVIAANWQ